MTTILALDLARVSGWAFGEPGAEPLHGSIQFANKDASHEAVFYKAMVWVKEHLVIYAPDLIVWEAPLATSFTRGKTNTDTTTLLYGLPAIVGAIAYSFKIYDVRKADTAKVRGHFLGCNPKRAEAKAMTVKQCNVMGWQVADDNEADALATWSYMCALLEPKQAMRPTPLFGQRRRA
jgi:hypothetical protein